MDSTPRSSSSAPTDAPPGARAGPERRPSLRRYRRHGLFPQLAAFEAVVRFGSAARAADALCIAAPTLSGQLRKLSEALDVRLFSLDGRRLVPTDAALVVLQAAREVAEALERCEETLSRWRGGAGTDQA